MSATAGWYPDPQGGPGRLRYWDGQSWTAHTTMLGADRSESAGQADAGGQAEPQSPVAAGPQQPAGVDPASAWAAAPAVPTWPVGARPLPQPASRGRRIAWAAAASAGVLVLVLGVGWFAGRDGPGGSTSQGAAAPGASPGGEQPQAGWPSIEGVSCEPLQPQKVALQTNDARVQAGGLSYPRPPEPWPQPEVSGYAMPLMAAEAVQMVNVAEYRDIGWAAGLMVMELRDDLGLQSVEQAARVAAGCMLATQYTVSLTHTQTRSEAVTVDGHRAWTIDSAITLDDPDLAVTHETMALTVVETAPKRYAMFWSSIPAVDPDYSAVAKGCRDGLRVG